ncbi:MAG: HRDC domain-containing protein, partial [Kineosporiaceae bacterium]
GSRTDRARAAAADLSPEAQARFEALRAWRAATAKEQGVPPYVVFHDTTLREVATRVPDSLAALASVGGVGEAKLARYGEGVLEVLATLAEPGSGG